MVGTSLCVTSISGVQCIFSQLHERQWLLNCYVTREKGGNHLSLLFNLNSVSKPIVWYSTLEFLFFRDGRGERGAIITCHLPVQGDKATRQHGNKIMPYGVSVDCVISESFGLRLCQVPLANLLCLMNPIPGEMGD
ncbi:hypothetical protein P170DRAFT_271368 [Aspergillus steynii IBT 23096]|uniref:Uncharacterized protein n=1 Tax=Aspergillus steynii IBT 23096 TaxID=1392250 RepID=A0A2I2FWR5_9EURO|nr:uncharacterized protein P170DRAFT_271368 [Aspergillus steynii IBT 23096]PLB45006.1 hypothetical protein P170DRAFT_271368 [Aspergillus steynii IBT 23096]